MISEEVDGSAAFSYVDAFEAELKLKAYLQIHVFSSFISLLEYCGRFVE